MINYKLQRVHINEIDTEDHKFRISNETIIDEISDSIKEYGLLKPPILLRNKNSYSIISGFKRVLACKKNTVDIINALVMQSNDEFLCYKVAILDNTSQKKIGFYESIKCIKIIKEFLIDNNNDEFIILVSKLLNLPYSKDYIIKLINISELPDNLIDLIDKERISFSIADELLKYDNNCADLIGEIFSNIKLSFNFQKELINFIIDIAKKENKHIEFILKDVNSILKVESLENNDTDSKKYYRLKSYLIRRRYPIMTDYNDILNNKISKIKSDKRIKIVVPKGREEAKLQLQMNFNKLSDFNELFNDIKKLKTNPDFIDLVEFQ